MLEAALGLRYRQSLFQVCLELESHLLLSKVEVGGLTRQPLPADDNLHDLLPAPLGEQFISYGRK